MFCRFAIHLSRDDAVDFLYNTRMYRIIPLVLGIQGEEIFSI